MVTLRNDGYLIGAASCRLDGNAAGFGYCIRSDYWGRGFATEAATVIVEWIHSFSDIHRVWATCDLENFRSRRVLEKMGLTVEKKLRRHSIRPNVSRRLRDALLYSKKIHS
jgi:RimJ/RimL family protein N-acetyltransferase